ncbi:zinc finger c-x8-C-x5-C-x3-H type (and similar) domain-containing protein [Ditylenchus destructor]|uniref:Zinc finger c-x8-C-x5-C-x3-H type (And similar) domain-containing protein n=1 Tax=Ditylenchus destructor TaxID=166010 RepID=A0AAD4QT91_9BILA|nr:zinc finger c-x8-C-x5-C-x3-H type (and similar) domain-containing protein [Ditylenchus destructor]
MAKQSVIDISLYINPAKTKEAKRNNGSPSRFEQTFKTVMCKSWLETLSCRFGGRCKFAHGVSELRHVDHLHSLASNPKYKTRLCVIYINKGICPYGHLCLFIHPNSAAGNTDVNNDNDPISSPESEMSSEYNICGISSLGQSNFNLFSCFSYSASVIKPPELDKSQEYNIWDKQSVRRTLATSFICS